MSTALHLAANEIWRNRGRFLLFSMVIALISVLVLFISALSQGLGAGNREYIEKLNGELIAYQDTARLSIPSSRLTRNTLRAIRNVDGVADVGPVGFTSSSIPRQTSTDPFDISLIGVEPGKPGEPPVEEGRGLLRRSTDEAVIDRTVSLVVGARLGDWIVVRTIRDGNEEYEALRVIGISDSRKYGIRPSVFVPYVTWDRIRSQTSGSSAASDLAYNIAVIKLEDPAALETMRLALEGQIEDIEVVDRTTAYQNVPGYSEQQSTLTTQNTFALLIGILVIGGFFQIQTLQKVGQIGMLKAIGTPNRAIAIASVLQIIMVTLIGVVIGAATTLALSLGFPPNIPIVFEPRTVAMALGSIALIGPLGGLVSIRYSLGVEPLVALGLAD